HHSHCGATTFTAGGIIEAYRHEQNADISGLYDRGSICIEDYEVSLQRDTALIRAHAGTPRHVNILGLFYDIDTGSLTEVVNDRAQAKRRPGTHCGDHAEHQGQPPVDLSITAHRTPDENNVSHGNIQGRSFCGAVHIVVAGEVASATISSNAGLPS